MDRGRDTAGFRPSTKNRVKFHEPVCFVNLSRVIFPQLSSITGLGKSNESASYPGDRRSNDYQGR